MWRAEERFDIRSRAAIAVLAAALPALGSINLELRSLPEACATRHLNVALYAVSDDNTEQSIGAMDVILSWDPAVLRLVGINEDFPPEYGWLFSGFPNDAALDGLNNTWLDGNALYTAWAQLCTPPCPAYADPDGLLVVVFHLRKLQVGTETVLDIPLQFGKYTKTAVYDGEVPGKVVTGALLPASVVPNARGDTNCDGFVNFGDINPFVLRLSDPDAYYATYPGCPDENSDLNCDTAVNFGDINGFVKLLTE